MRGFIVFEVSVTCAPTYSQCARFLLSQGNSLPCYCGQQCCCLHKANRPWLSKSTLFINIKDSSASLIDVSCVNFVEVDSRFSFPVVLPVKYGLLVLVIQVLTMLFDDLRTAGFR